MEEKDDFFKIVNIDKAKIKANTAIGLITLSLLTYIAPLLVGIFDFGMVFEAISLISIIIARKYMLKYDSSKAKKYTYISMVAIGWILIYDIIILIVNIQSLADILVLGYEQLIMEILSILYINLLFLITRDLAKAENPIKYKESTDWFYENKK